MGKKIFITYKYSDTSVRAIPGINNTKVRDYIDKIQDKLSSEDHINKGEEDGEDLSDFKNSTIESKLRDKIYDSSITFVIISKKMRNPSIPETDQWIPWEVAYSLREQTRNDRTSRTNAILAIVLPDEMNQYNYYIEENICPYCNALRLRTDKLFKILRNNMFNPKVPSYSSCSNHDTKVFAGDYSYIDSVKWDIFIEDINQYIDKALKINDNIENYNIDKSVE